MKYSLILEWIISNNQKFIILRSVETSQSYPSGLWLQEKNKIYIFTSIMCHEFIV